VAVLHAQSSGPPSRVARISALVGQASLQPSGSNEWSEAGLNYTVTTGDRLYTAQGSRAELEIGRMSIRISEEADITVTDLSDDFVQLGVAQGTLRLSVYRLLRGDSIEVDTPNGSLFVTAPGEYRIDVPYDNRFTVVSVDVGSLDVVGPEFDQELHSGQAVQLSGSDRIRVVSMPRPMQTAFDQWAAERDRRTSSAACARYMNREIPGCADLDDNGRWEANQQYGSVWYPTHVRADWVPYRDGRWVWVEPWGWSWIADEPWGYAPFHYGRWTRIGPSWAWVPGPVAVRPYYAPALVAFVGGAGWSVGVSIGSQAWFPLGPQEMYIPAYHHDDVYLRQVNVSNVRNITNVNTLINVQVSGRTAYANREAGLTAVSTDAFRSGRPIAPEVVRVRPEEVVRAPIVAHPSIAPIERSALPGRPVAAPPVAARPKMIAIPDRRGPPDRGDSRGRGRGERGATQTPPPPAVTQTPPPASATPPIPPAPPNQQQHERREIITRRAPPPESPPFKAKEEAMAVHPGRPLEPQQIVNVLRGRPAGPPKDPEVLPHPVVQGQVTPAKAPPGRGPQRGNKKDSTGRGRGGV